MSQLPRPRRLKFASNLFDRFARSTHFHPDFKLSWTGRFISWKTVLWTSGIALVFYYGLVGVADIGIYRRNADTSFTRAIENIFPFPAGVAGNQVISLTRFRKEVDARVVYSQKNKLTASKSEIEALVINQLIDKALYTQTATKYGVTVSTQDIDASLQNIYQQVGGQDKLLTFVHSNYGNSISLADFTQWVKESLVQSSLEHQVLQHAEVSHILIAVPANATDSQIEAARQKALDIKSKITNPSQFADIAKQYSEDVSSRDNGGALGTTVRGDDQPVISADFQNAIFSLPLNQVSDPIRSQYGWHLVLVTSRGGSIQESMKQFTQDLHNEYKPRAFIGT